MRIHFVGLGKLGLPVALALEQAGHTLSGWDTSEARREQIQCREVAEEAHEPLLGDFLRESRITLLPLDGLQHPPDVVMVAVQTPHQPEFEGCVPLSREPQDFDYTHLREAVSDVATAVRRRGIDPLIVVISTCLPGTFDRELHAIVGSLRFAYHPLFIAMGQVIEDFRNPEFVLVGSDTIQLPREFDRLYGNGVSSRAPIRHMSVTSAELTKVAYNAWLGYKIMLANGLAELSDEVEANVDDVLGTLKLATDRLVSTRYMDAGMGDGGGCHPRDQIALSWLAKEVGLSHDTFDVVIRAREAHAEWLADIWCDVADDYGLPMVMLGRAYKPNSTLTTGSAARLVEHYVRCTGRELRVEDRPFEDTPVACYFLATPHPWFTKWVPPDGSVMVDPWGLASNHDGLTVIRPGRRV